MANALHQKVWVIDTAAATNVTDAPVEIVGVRYVGNTTASDDAEIADGDGNVIWAAKGAAKDAEIDSQIRFRSNNGFRVPTLDSGKLYIYLR